MAIEKMELVKISAPLEKINEISATLIESECFHPRSAAKLFSSDMGFAPLADDASYQKRANELLELAGTYNITPELLDLSEQEDFSDFDDDYLDDVEAKLIKYSEETRSLNEQKEILLSGIQSFEHFKGLDVDLDEISQCRYIKVRFGHMPKESYKRLNTVYKDNPYIVFNVCSEDETDYWGAYFAPVDMLEEIDAIFAFLFFEPTRVPGAAGTVDEVINECQKSLGIISSQLSEIQGKTNEYVSQQRERLNYIYSKYVYLNSIREIRSYAMANDKGFVLLGYVPESSYKSLSDRLTKIDGVKLESETAGREDASVPVKYKKRNKLLGFLIEPYKFYIDMYGTPSYNDIDITAFVAVTYTILFGIMFGDLGQGFVLSVVGFLMWKLKKMGLGKILVPCGISSMFFGFMFGSVFGFEEMLDPVYEALGWAGKPLSVMESINTVLLIAIAIGVGLMVIAMLMNIYACIRRKHFGEALFSQNGLFGLLFYLAGANLASGFMGGPKPIPNSVCTVLLIVGAVVLFAKEILIGVVDRHPDWKPESIGDFVLQNLFELLEYVLSYLSNTVSFLRVGAFVLVHAGMMMVVFSLAGENENIFVIILGNVLVIALEGLLTGIQALRLEYYEMFSRFFDGSGVSFAPVRLNKQINN